MPKHYTKISQKELPKSEVEISGEIDFSLLKTQIKGALDELGKNVEMPGFRKGKIPEDILRQRLGEMTILQEAAERALEKAYPEIISDLKLSPITTPQVAITKLAPENTLEFKMKVAVFPELIVPQYQDIAKKENKKREEKIEVTEKDIDDVVEEIRKNVAHAKLHEKLEPHDQEHHNHGPIKESDFPEFNDDFVKSLGNFKDVEDFRTKAKENILKEKEMRGKEKRRMAIVEGILEKTSGELPDVLIENELDRMLLQFKDDVSRAGTSYETYLESIGKKEIDLRNEWRTQAEKKAKSQIILSKIAEKEKLEADGEKVRIETEKLLTVYQGVDPVKARAYVSLMFTNEKVFEFLENL